jgi:hypothetical protein
MIRSLSRTERRWARAAFGAIYPSHSCEAIEVGICDLDVEAFLGDLLRRIPLMAVLGLRVGIWIVALAPILVLKRFVTILGLTPGEQQALVIALLSSSSYAIRQLVVALKATGGLLFGGDFAVRSVARGEVPMRGALALVASGTLVRRAAKGGRHDGRVFA